MPNTPMGWEFQYGARERIDRALAQCKQEHGGQLLGEPAVINRKMVRNDGSEVRAVVLFVDDVDGWWNRYAQSHDWIALNGVRYECVREGQATLHTSEG